MVALRLAPMSHGSTSNAVHCNYAVFFNYITLCSELDIDQQQL